MSSLETKSFFFVVSKALLGGQRFLGAQEGCFFGVVGPRWIYHDLGFVIDVLMILD